MRVVSVWLCAHDLDMNEADVEHRHAARGYELLRGHDIIHDHTRGRGGSTCVTCRCRWSSRPTAPSTPRPAKRLRVRRRTEPVDRRASSAEHARHATGLRIAVIHHGIDLDGYPESSRARSHSVFLGRMSPDKGVHLVRATPARPACRCSSAKMREPGERDYFRREVAPGLGGDVIFVGEVAGTMKT